MNKKVFILSLFIVILFSCTAPIGDFNEKESVKIESSTDNTNQKALDSSGGGGGINNYSIGDSVTFKWNTPIVCKSSSPYVSYSYYTNLYMKKDGKLIFLKKINGTGNKSYTYKFTASGYYQFVVKEYFNFSARYGVAVNNIFIKEYAGAITYEVEVDPLTYSPDYEPDFWNERTPILMRDCNNCYNYACNVAAFEVGDRCFAVPGIASDNHYKKFIEQGYSIGEAVKEAAEEDGLEFKGNTYIPTPGPYQAVVALVVKDSDGNWHWYRQDRNGRWSHKDGYNVAKDRDNAGNFITDPKNADWGSKYNKFVGYFLVDVKDASGAQNTGAENICGEFYKP